MCTAQITDVSKALTKETPAYNIYSTIHHTDTEWDSDGFQLTKAYVMAVFSELAYINMVEYDFEKNDRYKIIPSLTQREMITRRWSIDITAATPSMIDGYSEVFVINRFVYLVYRTTRFVVVAVRGTEFFSFDWLINFNIKKNGAYHQGFYEEAQNAVGPLEQAVERAAEERIGPTEIRSVYFTGHSMGGAVAAILAQIWGGSLRPRFPYIFASPRFAVSLSMSIQARPPYSYRIPGDLVPHLPPQAMGFADIAGSQIIPQDKEDQSGLATLSKWMLLGPKAREPHSMEFYRQNVGRELERNIKFLEANRRYTESFGDDSHIPVNFPHDAYIQSINNYINNLAER
jgi:hypothetical protein